MLIQELPQEERPREKLARHGARTLTDAELLAIFLRTGRRGRSAIMLARDLIEAKGSLRGIARCAADELSRAVSGIGQAKASELCAAVELGRRLALAGEDRPQLDNSRAVFERYGPILEMSDREHVMVALLDTRLRLIRDETVSIGSLNEAVAHPREIFRSAIIHSSHAFVLIHNHPSGDPMPSPADFTLTRRIKEAADVMLINFMDHIIIGNADGGRQPYYSFRDSGSL